MPDRPANLRTQLAGAARLGFVVLAALFAYAFVATAKDGEERRSCSALCALAPNYAATARRAPDFELPSLSGKRIKLSDYRGKVVILNFWSRSCPPCLEEMPALAQLAHQLAARGDAVLLTINTDEDPEEARAAVQSLLGVTLPFEVLSDPESKVVSGLFGTRLYPETWFVDGAGVIRARVDGARDWAKPLTLELVDALSSPLACGVTFEQAEPSGPRAGLCGELGR